MLYGESPRRSCVRMIACVMGMPVLQLFYIDLDIIMSVKLEC